MPLSPAEAHVVALTMLVGMGPARLNALLVGAPPGVVWAQLQGGTARAVLAARAGVTSSVVDSWVQAARLVDIDDIACRYQAAGVTVSRPGEPGYPTVLVDDPEPPAVIFSRGEAAGLAEHRCVAIVGTRSCTRYGLEVARELGECLGGAGVAVVSGLAVGIDAAAHAGALAAGGAPPVGVVGSGLDVVYPRANAGLWQRIGSAGLLLSEAPLGARPERWRFPARNRIIAGLSEVVVVVESHERGGSLSTVDEALDRGVTVMAVPGSILSPASAGSNRLIADGSMPVCCAADVLEALGLKAPIAAAAAGGGRQAPAPPPRHAAVLDAFAWQPASLELLQERTGQAPGELALALEALESSGWVERRGLFYERSARPEANTGPQAQPE
jgi:DNA processing protein